MAITRAPGYAALPLPCQRDFGDLEFVSGSCGLVSEERIPSQRACYTGSAALERSRPSCTSERKLSCDRRLARREIDHLFRIVHQVEQAQPRSRARLRRRPGNGSACRAPCAGRWWRS